MIYGLYSTEVEAERDDHGLGDTEAVQHIGKT